ncbi:MAG: hypothetical protein NWF14_03490 [Candidatus Bathyarchaeota archaeon]|nr:hypothetical protein [Candidatus Bathyarchaeota archaeon]
MKIGWIVIGGVLIGLGWWVAQPFQYDFFGLFPVITKNPLAPLSFPFLLVGGAAVVYGLLPKSKKR